MEAPDFFVENLLDLPNGDEMITDAFFGNSTDSASNGTPIDSCNSSVSGADNNYPIGGERYDGRGFPEAHFSGELCVPYDAELEWLSNFVEESFSSEDLHKLHFIPAPNSNPPNQYHHPHQQSIDTNRQINPIFAPVTLVPGKARSKLARVAPSDWSTRLQAVTPPTTSSSDTNNNAIAHHLHSKKASKKRVDTSLADNNNNNNINGEIRRCLHCAAEKTPQWRTGPMGPKTLCNACGVRFKSGRLVPEYRPAASPTFISTKHSNSHRKVMELRRQKDMGGRGAHHQQQQLISHGGVFGMSSNVVADDYLIHHHMGPDYRQMI